MPTPVNAARQCLTDDAAAALDESVAVARRRGHAQTTSMHMVSSLLSLPNSSLRESCMRTRNNAYSTRVQFKALELSLSVALERLPSSQAGKIEQPPVSNSLMAAIKRSQANQRRQPENYSYYQQQQQQQYSSCSSVPIVKVELQNLILSILDDPLVSRVFGEAGFRSYDIKTATLRPGNGFHAHHLFGYSSRYKRPPNPPLFLCNFGSGDGVGEVGGKSFSFPFMGCFSRDENSRRIGEVMVKDKKRNPLLLGVSSGDALGSFLEVVRGKVDGVLPVGLSGLSVICVKDEILRFVNGDLDQGSLKLRLEEVGRMVENVVGTGVVLNFGDFKELCGDVCNDGLRYLVSKLTGLLQINGGKLWLIGAVTTHEIYFKFLNKFPSIEDDWDLQIVPITSLTFSMGGSYPRSSLMESFVPLGGFFSMPSDTKSMLGNSCHYVVRCHLCNEKCEQEIKALSNGGICDSVVEHSRSSLPSWIQTAEYSTQNGVADLKAKDDRLSLNAKIAGIQKKWDSSCQHHHYNQAFPKGYTSQFSYPFPRVTGFQVTEKGKENASKECSNHSNESSPEQGSKNVISSLSTDLLQSPSLKESNTLGVLSKNNNLNLLSKPVENPLEFDCEVGGLKLSASRASINNGRKSPISITSVTTDLGLGTVSDSANKEFEKCFQQYKVNDPKTLYKFLVERVGQQEEAIYAVIEAITRCHTKMTGLRGASHSDTWFNFRGPDRLGKRKLGLALGEMLYGSTDSFIYADLSFQDEMIHIDAVWNQQVMNKYDVSMRGTVVDYLVEKLSKKPSVVFLENVDKADLVVQNSLFRAVKTGRLTDLSGREVNISNSMFLVTTRFTRGSKCFSSGNESSEYSEEEISLVKGRPIQILIGFDLNDDPTSENSTKADTILVNKRKLTGSNSRGRGTDRIGIVDMSKRAHKAVNRYLDLNLPADASETFSTEGTESDSSSESSKSWLEDFEGQIDRVVVFERFDFEKLAEKLIKDIKGCSSKILGFECSLEIESNVMHQLLAAAYIFDVKKVEDWIQRVFKQGFIEAIGKYSIDARSIVKLQTCEGVFSEEQQQAGVLLPAKIILN